MAIELRPSPPDLDDDLSSSSPHPDEPSGSQRQRPSVETVVTVGLVAGAVLFTLAQLQPSLLLAKTTPAGGDMGAHVWGPDFIRRALLPHGRLMGWAPDWYAGFPAYSFYFPLPALAIVALDVVLPYGIAFKLVTVAGILSLPVAAWAFGRLAGMRFPGPPLLAVATVPFLFDRGFTIYGGNIASTLAGEFGFSISLSLAFLFLGVVARGLDTGRHRGLAAVLLALTGLCHLLPTVFAVVGALVLLAFAPRWRRIRFMAGVLVVGALLAAFWSFPFLMRLPYANDMGWGKLTDYMKQLFPHNLRWLVVLAGVGALCSLSLRRRVGQFFVAMAALSAMVFVLAPQARLWNARALPFWFISLYMLAAVGLAETGPALARGFAADPGRWARGFSFDPDRPGLASRLATPVAVVLVTWMLVALPLGVIPSWVPKPATTDSSFIPGWARWNYSGYERKDAYPEYKAVVDMMADVGRTRGCGRAHWEYEEDLNRFGTPMALMLLPYWTQGCIGSMEGLYFESSATTPYHFLTAGEVSAKPSNPQRDLPYVSDRPDLDAGIPHMQMLGTRYYMAFSPEAVSQAEDRPELTLVATSGKWKVYEVAGSELVAPLQFQPAVLTGAAKGGTEWLGVATKWFMDPEAQDVLLAASGPKSWGRVAVHHRPTKSTTVGEGVTVGTATRRPVDPVVVSRIRTDNANISFDVDKPGSPVLVKSSYFPNWRASGAEGPWRVSPNLMVVVPTSRHVTLHYAWTPVEVIGWLLTLGGVATMAAWAVRSRRPVAGEEPDTVDSAGADDGPDGRDGFDGSHGPAEGFADPVARRSPNASLLSER